MHVLIANKQFLLLIDVPIQDRSQQIMIYETFTLDIPHGNFTAHCDVTTKYLGITKDETMAVDLSKNQFFMFVKQQMDNFALYLHLSSH